MCEASRQDIERAELRASIHQEALDSWEHYEATGLHVTGEEVFAWLDRLAAGEDVDPPACHT